MGAFVGLLALLLGALYNAKLTRARDERLHEIEIRSLASAFMGEIASLYNIATIRHYVKYLEDFANDKEKNGGSEMPHVMIKHSYTTIYDANASNIGRLPQPLPHNIAHTYIYLKSFLEDMDSMSCGLLDDQDVGFQVQYIRNAQVLLENLMGMARDNLLPMLSEVCGGRYQLIDDIMTENSGGQTHGIHPNDTADHS